MERQDEEQFILRRLPAMAVVAHNHGICYGKDGRDHFLYRGHFMDELMERFPVPADGFESVAALHAYLTQWNTYLDEQERT